MDILHGTLLPLNLSVRRPYPVTVGFLLFQEDSGSLRGLVDKHQEHTQHGDYRNDNLNDAAVEHTLADGADLIADHIVPNQNGQHPVGAFHRNIAQVILKLMVFEGCLPLSALRKVLFQLLITVSLPHLGIRESQKQIVPCFEISELIVGQILTVAVKQIAVRLIFTGLQCEGT